MNPLFELSLVCGLLILFPGITFGCGLWLIVHYFGFQRRISAVLFAVLLGLVAFEGSLIGMAIDPRTNFSWPKLLGNSGLIGIGTTAFVLIFTPVFVGLFKILKR